MGALLPFRRARRPAAAVVDLPPVLTLQFRTWSPTERNAPLLAKLVDEDGNIVVADGVKAVDGWLKANGYRWSAGTQGVYVRERVA